MVTPQNNQEGPSAAWHTAAGKPHRRDARREVGRAGRAARLPAGEGAGNLSCVPRPAPQPGLPVPSILILLAGSRCVPPHSPLPPIGLAERPAQSKELSPSQGRGSRVKRDPRAPFERGALGKHHVGGAGGEKWPSPAASHKLGLQRQPSVQPSQGGEERARGCLRCPGTGQSPAAYSRPGRGPPALTHGCRFAPQTQLALTPCNTYRSQTTSPGWGEAQLLGGSPAAPRHQRPMLPRALGAPCIQGCPARGSPRAAHSSICQLVSFPGAGRGGPAPSKPSAAPLQAWEGFDICPLWVDKVYECLQRCPRPGGCGRVGAHPRQGPIGGTVVVSSDQGVQPAALTMGCSLPGSPLQPLPLLTFLWGAAHACHPLKSVEVVPKGTGCTHSMASTALGAQWQQCAALQAPEPSRHQSPAGTPPRAARAWQGRLEALAASHLSLGGTSPGPPMPPMPSHPPEPSVAVTCQGARRPQLQCQ